MRKLALFFFLSSILLFDSCTSGKKAFNNGDYYSAVIKSVSRLRKSPNHKKSKEALRRAYPLALKSFENNATNALNSNRQFKFKEALRQYEMINTMYNQINASPSALKIISMPVNYFTKVNSIKEQAAGESYDEALQLLANNNREDAKSAYLLFKDTESFSPNYKEVREKMNEAKFLATLKVIVEQIPVPVMYNLSGSFFQDKVEEYLHSQYGNEFVRFYTQHEANVENLPFVDQHIRLQFDDFVVGETHLERMTEKISRDSVVTGTVKTRAGEQNVYSTVYAKLTINRKEVRSRGLLSMLVIDSNTKAVLTHKKISGEFIWLTEWGNYNGDERALTDQQLATCELHDVPPPPPQALFIEFTKPIYDQLVPAINYFYRRY